MHRIVLRVVKAQPELWPERSSSHLLRNLWTRLQALQAAKSCGLYERNIRRGRVQRELPISDVGPILDGVVMMQTRRSMLGFLKLLKLYWIHQAQIRRRPDRKQLENQLIDLHQPPGRIFRNEVDMLSSGFASFKPSLRLLPSFRRTFLGVPPLKEISVLPTRWLRRDRVLRSRKHLWRLNNSVAF